MASPQTENGYTRISNEILEQIARIKLSPTQYRLILVIWRYTYGFKRKEHQLSSQFLANATGCDKRLIRRELKELHDKNIIIQKIDKTKTREIGFNKNYDQWEKESAEGKIDPSAGGEIDPSTEGKIDPSAEVYLDPQERKILKKNNKEIIDHFEMIWKLYPNKLGKAKIKDSQKEKLYEIGDEIVRTIERYKATKEDWKAWQHGSTFFNTGYIDFLDENYEEPEEEILKVPRIKVDSS